MKETVPQPDFIGNKIRDHVFFNQRYVITAGEVVGLSETDDIFISSRTVQQRCRRPIRSSSLHQ